jgi:hypothetical protein
MPPPRIALRNGWTIADDRMRPLAGSGAPAGPRVLRHPLVPAQARTQPLKPATDCSGAGRGATTSPIGRGLPATEVGCTRLRYSEWRTPIYRSSHGSQGAERPRPLGRKGEGLRPLLTSRIPSPSAPKLPRIKSGVAKAQSPLPLGEAAPFPARMKALADVRTRQPRRGGRGASSGIRSSTTCSRAAARSGRGPRRRSGQRLRSWR